MAVKAQKNQPVRGRGRPKGSDTYTEEKANEIIYGLVEGNTLTSISKRIGVPLRTIFDWTYSESHKDFSARFARARELGTEILEEQAIDLSDNQHIDQETFDQETESGTRRSTKTLDNVARSRLMAEIRLKVVARRKGKDIRLNADVKSTSNVQAEIKNLPTQSLEQIREILLKAGKE